MVNAQKSLFGYMLSNSFTGFVSNVWVLHILYFFTEKVTTIFERAFIAPYWQTEKV